MRLIILSLVTLSYSLFGLPAANAQINFTIKTQDSLYVPNELLNVHAEFKIKDKAAPPATLNVTIENDNGTIWRMRWPIIDGKADGSINFSEELKNGNYKIYYDVQPRFFAIYGQLLQNKLVNQVYIAITNGASNYYEKNIPVKNNKFSIQKVAYPGDAYLYVRPPAKQNNVIYTVDTWLDSTYTPVASYGQQINIKQGAVSKINKLDAKLVTAKVQEFANPYHNWQALNKAGMSDLEVYDSLFVHPNFKKATKQFDFIKSDSLINAGSFETYLEKNYFNRKITIAEEENRLKGIRNSLFLVTRTNKKSYFYFLDNNPLTWTDLNNLLLIDILSIKIIENSPFKDGTGIIAIYTKAGVLKDNGIYKAGQKIKGYDHQSVNIQ
ncbi:hypothetical protein [Polluticaenibacter yanchengensis]|uniref:Macroglobulin domain-containing protein n=1 Tax=Polluticaenibacter yanchengensis TaxID=3014562 RepID=A0ABT4UJB5_9BACT|nr:hypothetical protein [Chitinophagaceae bacterium LY-5]